MSNTTVTFTETPRFFGCFDGFENGTARGWAVCNSTPLFPVKIHVIIDGQEIMTVTANLPRVDVQAALGLPTEDVGFAVELPIEYLDGHQHTLSLHFADRSPLPLSPDGKITSFIFSQKPKPIYKSCVDGVIQGALRGWVLSKGPNQKYSGKILLSVLIDGICIGQTRADRYRADVAATFGCDPNCGFEFSIPQSLRGNAQHKVQILTLPDRLELEGSPFSTSFANDALESRIVDVTNELDDLYRRIGKLRQELRNMLPNRPYSLGNYDHWARKYYSLLEKRIEKQRILQKRHGKFPLVSILCPVYRPLESDFEAAIQSVLNQTYSNWELILVDDAGKKREVTNIINKFTKIDSRIKSIVLTENVGISEATNVAIDTAKGDYIVFFDHDDLLVNVAIEVMVHAARDTGAQFLYSDEDKIDQAGYFLEPNFKPDFNYRYLLGCNYICHLTMATAGLVRKVGPLRSEYNGAQDHDFVLRVTEILKPSDIFHVPEILYHWRKTPNSTAVDVSQKAYAIQSGVNCVSDHLKRRKIASKVSSIRGLTLYSIDWKFRKQPSVTIIIPFKDQVDTTRICVESILNHTDYKNYQIILVDNWSTHEETHSFMSKIVSNKNVHVITVEEPFNFSRLNNIAVAETSSEFIVFMNNDVFVEDPNWLHRMVGEASAFSDVGAVGAKLLYPNNTIQHAGVVVGSASVAAHVHRGDSSSEYGYIGRTMLRVC